MNKIATDAAAQIPLIVADIYELAGLLRARGDRIAAAIGQTQARWQVLSAASDQPLSVPRIARRLGLTRQAVQRIADLLVGENLAGYADNPDHKASPHLVLTKSGRDTLARLTKTARAGHQELAAKLEGVELPALRRDLRALLAALNGSAKFNRGE
ncbi:MAG TPA: MarR family transcriptional regulator [Stellaceae bacterium]|nr:MarR family transcriptional regulator [Stellaceae bacterium]